MSSFSSQFNPRANVFLIVNLGCEMLYVIDQRLKAQEIEKTKAAQVFSEITAVLLDSKLIESLIKGSIHEHSALLTVEHCRCMLNDIATSSLMRLDESSMDKLWNLMTMVYKWQLFVSKYPHHLLDNTFRHLESIGKLYPNVRSSMLVDCTKNTLLDFWNSCGDETQLSIYRTNKAWHQCFNTKISLLIRLGFQALDSSFIRDVEESYFGEFVDSAGENVYIKSIEIAAQRREELFGNGGTSRNRVEQLQADILGTIQAHHTNAADSDDTETLQQFQKCSMLFEELGVKKGGDKATISEKNVKPLPKNTLDMSLFPEMAAKAQEQLSGEFVPVKTVYNRNSEASSSESSLRANNLGAVSLNKELLDVYSKMH